VDSSDYTAYKTKDGVKVYSCLKCTYRTFRKSDVHRHSVVHTGARPYVCPVCHKRFTQRTMTVTDHFFVASQVIKPFACELCNYSTTRKASLKRHSVIHTDLTPYNCVRCDKKFKHRTSLKYHYLSHFKQK
ncbi:unnamed protein product, partial [Larinioides sclopetarius]